MGLVAGEVDARRLAHDATRAPRNALRDFHPGRLLTPLEVCSRRIAGPDPSYYSPAVAVLAPSPTDESTAQPAKRSPNESDGRPFRFGQSGRKTAAARRIVAVKSALNLLGRVALGAVGLACAAGCSDRDLVLVGPSTSSTFRNGLVGLWHFDDVPGPTVADSSGNKNDGTLKLFADPSSVWVPGKFGTALSVQAGGYVSVPLSTSIDGIASGVTVSAWVYFEGNLATNLDYGTAISRQVGTTIDQYYHLSLRGPDPSPNLFISPMGTMTGPVTPSKAVTAPRATWIHLAGTYDDGGSATGTGTATLYLNGDMIGTKQVMGRFQNDTTQLILGGNGNNSDVMELFPGRIDEIALYNRPLSPLEIQQLAQGPIPP